MVALPAPTTVTVFPETAATAALELVYETASPELAVAAKVKGASPTLLRSEEHTSELQSRRDLVCRLLLEKKKKIKRYKHYPGVYGYWCLRDGSDEDVIKYSCPINKHCIPLPVAIRPLGS